MFSRSFMNISHHVLPKSTYTVYKITCHRTLHLACCNLRRDFVIHTKKSQFYVPVLSATFIRHLNASSQTENASTSQTENVLLANSHESNVTQSIDTSKAEEIITQIPEPPPTPIVSELLETINGEPSLKSLDLGGWSPSGMIQQYLDFLHVTFGLPWWGTIVCTTLCIRLLLFPLVIKMQRSAAKMHNLQPQMQYIQQQLNDARQMGDQMEATRLSHELYSFMKEKQINPIKSLTLPLIQAPIFISFFWGLRGMVNAPVESMKTGGILWFEDLTISDQYYLLPLLTSITMFITIELGTDSVKIQSLGMMKYFMRLLPIVVFPIILKFEGAILCYWVSTNLFSLMQVSILKVPKMRQFFNIPQIINHDVNKLAISKKGFVEGFKDSWTNLKVARDLKTRQMYDEQVFHQAGRGPVPKTYKYDPTKQL